jgi:hypothetical protein
MINREMEDPLNAPWLFLKPTTASVLKASPSQAGA